MIIEDALFSEGTELLRLVKLYMKDGLVNIIPDVEVESRYAIEQLESLNKLRRAVLENLVPSSEKIPLRTWGGDRFDFRDEFIIRSVFKAYGRIYTVGQEGESLCVDSGISILQENNRLLEEYPYSKSIEAGIDGFTTYLEF